jgi:hypothetical protein
MQSNKSTRKSDGEFHYTPTSTTRNYYEEIIDRDGPLSFTNLETQYAKVFSKTLLTGFQLVSIVGFSQENFKRFYKLPKVRQLTDCLYNVAFEI